MAWGRGFFRIWLFLSALWIGLTVYLSEPKTYKFWRTVYEVKYQNAGSFEIDLAKSQTDLAVELTKGVRAVRPDINSLELQKDSDALLTYIKSEHQIGMDKAKSAWMLTVLPPLALLGFGLCIVWMARGFRPAKLS